MPSIIELLISLTLSLILLSGMGHYVFTINKIYQQIQQQFAYQNSVLIARHYIYSDLINNRTNITSSNYLPAVQNIKPGSDILIMPNVIYYLRKSIIPHNDFRYSYALYRHDLINNVTAIAEGLENMLINRTENIIIVTLTFKDSQQIEIICALR